MSPDFQQNKKVFVETYGCQMNEYDTELVRGILVENGFSFVESEDEADIVMLNTCSVRENAHRKVYGRIHSIKHRRNGNPVMIGILGCMAANLRTALLENRRLAVDFIAGPDSYKRLPKLIGECYAARQSYDVTLSEFETYSDIYPVRKGGVNAWVAVMRGCNNFCTFCVVPYTRGRERSRSPENVVGEVRQLVRDGFKQVTLLGQNVNSYHYEGADFADLIEAVSRVEGLARVRFTSPHPKDFPDKLLNAVARNPRICKHIHLPLQSGNDRILGLMNRTYTQEEFLRLVDKIRAKCPGVALTTDIIVGFPSETDEEFEDTVKVMKRVEFDSAFIFKYSQRRGTIAQRKFPDDVPPAKKTERIVRLNALQKDISLRKNQGHIGEIHEILIEDEHAPRSLGKSAGRTDGHKIVLIDRGSLKQGDIVKVKITGASPSALKGLHCRPIWCI